MYQVDSIALYQDYQNIVSWYISRDTNLGRKYRDTAKKISSNFKKPLKLECKLLLTLNHDFDATPRFECVSRSH